MKLVLKTILAIIAATSIISGASAIEFTKGSTKKVDAKAMKVTIIHELLENLDMPAMTMVFRVRDEAIMAKLKEGANIEFVADHVEGKLTVTEIK